MQQWWLWWRGFAAALIYSKVVVALCCCSGGGVALLQWWFAAFVRGGAALCIWCVVHDGVMMVVRIWMCVRVSRKLWICVSIGYRLWICVSIGCRFSRSGALWRRRRNCGPVHCFRQGWRLPWWWKEMMKIRVARAWCRCVEEDGGGCCVSSARWLASVLFWPETETELYGFG